MIQDIVTAIGLVLVIEGLLWAVFPTYGRKLLDMVANMPEADLRQAGLVAVAFGVLVVWLVRG